MPSPTPPVRVGINRSLHSVAPRFKEARQNGARDNVISATAHDSGIPRRNGDRMNWIWRRLTHNLGWKLGALALAVLLWVATVGEQELVTTHAVSILYRDLPGDLLVGSDALDVVRVDLRGPASKLTTASLADLAITLNLSDVNGPGQRTFTVSSSDLHLAPGVVFLRAVPSQLRINFPRRVSKDVPVEIQVRAQPAAGYRVVSQEVIPPTVRIVGPEGRVSAIAGAQTDAIDLSTATSATEIQVNAFVSDPQVWMETPSLVTVRVGIEKNGQIK
jgi:YbbR domain-containing protein